jgi:hypothetical protein
VRLVDSAVCITLGSVILACGGAVAKSPSADKAQGQPAVGAPPADVPSMAAGPTITDTTPRPQMPLEAVLAALPKVEHEVIVGVKETAAVRGVSTRGQYLPLTARDSAVAALRAAFPALPILRVLRTAVVVRMPADLNLLRALRAHPVVDYIEPNHRDGVGGSREQRSGPPPPNERCS